MLKRGEGEGTVGGRRRIRKEEFHRIQGRRGSYGKENRDVISMAFLTGSQKIILAELLKI